MSVNLVVIVDLAGNTITTVVITHLHALYETNARENSHLQMPSIL